MTRKRIISQQYDQVFGTMKVKRGKSPAGKQLWSWDALTECTNHACPAAARCHYIREDLVAPEKCQVMLKYLKAVSQVVFGQYEAVLDEGQLYRVGMHIIPLYRNLCRFKIYELGLRSVVHSDDKGKVSVDPVYKEIREHIKLLEQMWKSVGLTGSNALVPPLGDEDFHPDANYYEEMEKGAMADIHQERGRKLSLVRRAQTNE